LLLKDWLHNWSSGGEKNCLVSSLFCILLFIFDVDDVIVVIIIVIIIIIIVVLLSCLYLNPQVLLFVHSPSHPTGVGGGASEWLRDPSCCLQG